ncbi:MAG: DUF2490 domain-containing protein [Flavobacteriales bacterium]|jgi:hypothetical protein|nr:MAG: DUF2490 domain-containing protein [Flavobacteriales bacterium]
MRGRSLLITALLLAALSASAQEPLRPERRQELWLSVAATGRLPGFLKDPLGDRYKRFRLRAELGYRSADVFFAGRQTYLDVNLRYKAASWLNVAFEHRFAARSAQTGLRHRSILQAEASHEIDRFTGEYRFVYQHTYIPFGGQREVLRNRFRLGYDFRKWKLDPEVSVEFFTWAGYKGWSYFGTRWSVGTSYAFSKAHSLSAALVHDRERDIAWPTHRWIASVTYGLSLRDL